VTGMATMVCRSLFGSGPDIQESSQEIALVPVPEGRWKLGKPRSMLRTEHRLEAYATLAFRTVGRSLRAIPGAIAVHPE
jgi:hypothetical protein